MKNLKIVLVMFIVSIAGIANSFAQTGTSFARPGFEYQNDPVAIHDNFREMIQKAFGRGDFSCFQRQGNETPSVAPVVIINAIAEHMKTQAGLQSLTGIEIMEMFRHGQVTYAVVGPEYWDTHENAYFTYNGGLAWWDPRGTKLPVLKDRKWWVIETFHFPNGGTADFVGTCVNPSRLKLTDTNIGGYQSGTSTAASGPGTATATSSITVMLASPATQAIAVKNTSSCKWVKPVLIGVGAAAVIYGGIKLVEMLTKKKDGTYSNNQFQGSGGSSWPAGSGGSTPGTTFGTTHQIGITIPFGGTH